MPDAASIPLPDGSVLSACVALPAGSPPPGGWPGVVVVFEAFGMTTDMRGVCDRFAEAGYVGVLPDLYSHGKRIFCLMRAMREAQSHARGPVTADIEATRAWLADRPDVDGARLGVIGFCMGGGLALMFAAAAPDGVRAASVNYGEVPASADALRRVCPVVGSYGGRDRSVGPKGRLLERHLSELGVAHDVKVYENAGHSFMTKGSHPVTRALFGFVIRPGYVPDAADDAWRRVFAFFDQHVRGGT